MLPNDSQSPSTCSQVQAASPDRTMLMAEAVRTLCGGISDMTLWRWLNDPDLGFPRPVIINRLRYWRQAEVLAWLDSREVAA